MHTQAWDKPALDVNIRSSDYFLVRFCQQGQSLLRRLANWETRLLAQDLAPIQIQRPVFITGLARSGTTLLLELLAMLPGAATHRYRDFPFVLIPHFWNRYLDWFPVEQQPVERAHQDRIFITRENPEGMEEPLWQAFYPHLHSADAVHRLTAADADERFAAFYREHLRKILFIRPGTRYFAKNNYHVARLEYLLHLFPDAHFIVPVRHPLNHVHSLVRQHELFSRYAAADARVPRYLAAAGHYEFGPQRVPIQVAPGQSARILEAWATGNEYLGYARQWHDVYQFVEMLRTTRGDIAERTLVVKYEQLCAHPTTTMQHILDVIGVEPERAGRLFDRLKDVSPSQHTPNLTDDQRDALWSEVSDLAAAYEYSPGGD